MRAWQVTERGAPPQLCDISIPSPGAGEVRVAIRACGLNFADLLMIEGKYQERPALPFILGMEVAGTVTECGPGAGLPIGSRVAVFAGQGGLAEEGCFPAARCVPIPDGMSFETAAGFQIAYGTSHLALTHRARLQPGEALLVLGAAGGVGLTAVEIGKRMGARVIASARGAERLAVARAAGADVLIDSDAGDLRERVKALGGADVVYDAVGGPAFGEALRATRPDGRMLVIGFASGEVPPVPANVILVKNVSVLGFYWGGYLGFAPHLLRESLATLFAWQADGGLRPHVSHVLPFESVPEGLALLRNRAATGKIVVSI